MVTGQYPYQEPASGIAARINEIEEKIRLLKDRVLLIGKNLISVKEESEKEMIEIKKILKDMREEISQLNQFRDRVIYELQNIPRKYEIEVLKKQIKMFEPLEIARIKDVKKIIKSEIRKSTTYKNA